MPRGTARSLDAKLEAALALAAWQKGDTAGTCGALSAFVNEGASTSGEELSEAQAQQLTTAANDIRAKSAVELIELAAFVAEKPPATKSDKQKEET